MDPTTDKNYSPLASGLRLSSIYPSQFPCCSQAAQPHISLFLGDIYIFFNKKLNHIKFIQI